MKKEPIGITLEQRVKELEKGLEECLKSKDILTESRNKYRYLFNNIKDALFVHQPLSVESPGRFIEVNDMACERYEYSRDEFFQLTPKDIVPPEDIRELSNRIEALFKERHTLFRATHLTKSGKRIPSEINAHLFDFDGRPTILAIVRDMTSRRQMESLLREERNRAQQYFDIAGVILIAIDLDGIVTRINKKGCEVLGYKEKEILGKNWFENWIPAQDRSRMRDIFKKIMEGNLPQMEYYENPVLTKDGELKTIAWHNALLQDDEGNTMGTLSSGEDITLHRRSEEERIRLQLMLQQAQKMEAIGTLAGGIAHDFNNILTPLIIHTEMALLDIGSNHAVSHNLEQILFSARRARDLVRQILTFSRQQDQETKPLKVGLILKEALKLLRASLPSTIEIHQEIATKGDTIIADPIQIHQLFMNLATNAAHAMREKGGALMVRLEEKKVTQQDRIQIPDLKAGPYLRLSIGDTGHGIAQDLLKRIFEPYFTTKVKGEGTGMGLAVVHGIVTSHGGAITIQSEVGKGTTFDVYLPKTVEDDNSIVAEERVDLPTGTETILLVDDEPSMIEALRLMLSRLKYKVEARTSSIEALQAFRANPHKFDLIITDMTMPHLTGLELAREIFSIQPDIPIILCTGFSDLISEEKAKAAGIREFVMKPLVMNEIAVAIRRTLDG